MSSAKENYSRYASEAFFVRDYFDKLSCTYNSVQRSLLYKISKSKNCAARFYWNGFWWASDYVARLRGDKTFEKSACRKPLGTLMFYTYAETAENLGICWNQYEISPLSTGYFRKFRLPFNWVMKRSGMWTRSMRKCWLVKNDYKNIKFLLLFQNVCLRRHTSL